MSTVSKHKGTVSHLISNLCAFTSFSYSFLALLARIFNTTMNQCGESEPNYIVPNHRGKWKVTVKAKVAQSCPTLWDPIDYTAHGILQARILAWVAFPFSRGSSQLRDRTQVSCIAGGLFTNWSIRETQVNSKCKGSNLETLRENTRETL